MSERKNEQAHEAASLPATTAEKRLLSPGAELARCVDMGVSAPLRSLVAKADPFWRAPGDQHTILELALFLDRRDCGEVMRVMLEAPQFQDALRDPRMDHLLALCMAARSSSETFQRLLPYFSGERANAPFCASDLNIHGLQSAAQFRPTPLMLAALRSDTEAVAVLFSAGADPSRIDSEGCCSLMHWARSKSTNSRAVRASGRLLLPRANPELRNVHGFTAFLHAAKAGNLTAIQELLPLSDPLAQTHGGWSAWDFARAGRFWGILDILSGFVDPGLADAALASGGAELMPLHAARTESSSIWSAMAEPARSRGASSFASRPITPGEDAALGARRAKSL